MEQIHALLGLAGAIVAVVAYAVRIGQSARQAQKEIEALRAMQNHCAALQDQRHEQMQKELAQSRAELKDLINELLVAVRLVEQKVDGLNGRGGH